MPGRYARGHNAVAICDRCSAKRLRRELVYDGQYPDLLVCPDCWDPKHPQEYLPPTHDPVTIYDPTGDPDKTVANQIIVKYPPLWDVNTMLTADMDSLPLRYQVLIGSGLAPGGLVYGET
jgi:hypothetical protein